MEQTYKISANQKRALVIALMLLLIAIIVPLFFGKFGTDITLLTLVWAFLAGWAAILISREIRISDDGIENYNLLRTRHLSTDAIAGWRIVPKSSKSGIRYCLEVCPKDKNRDKAVVISSHVQIDIAFKDWISKFPNLTTIYNLGFFGADLFPKEMTEKYFAQWGL